MEAAGREQVLLDNDWVRLTVPGLPDRVRAERIREALDEAHEHYARLVERGAWAAAFSGKEIVHELVSWIFTKGRPPGNTALQDLAKAVAQQQLEHGVPAELLELRQAMLDRLPR